MTAPELDLAAVKATAEAWMVREVSFGDKVCSLPGCGPMLLCSRHHSQRAARLGASLPPAETLALIDRLEQAEREVERLRGESIISTPKDLDALPIGSVVLSSAGSIACRWDGDRTQGVIFGRAGSFPWLNLALPVTVLHQPKDPS